VSRRCRLSPDAVRLIPKEFAVTGLALGVVVNRRHDRLDEEASEAEFLEKLGRTKKAASGHFSYVEHTAMVLRRRGEVPVRREPTLLVTIANAPSIVVMNDEPRQFVAPRSLTSEFFGDPPPGRSALERK
jgi:hypothetical protein